MLSACIPNKWYLDSGLFSGQPCKAPCWNNLTPGKSTAADVDHYLNSLSAKDWPVRRSTSEAPKCKDVQIRNKPGLVVDTAVTFTIENGVLILIESIPYYPLTLQDLVAHLGPPEYFKAVLAVGPDGSDYQLEVYYPSKGLAFRVSTSDAGFIRPNMRILTIQYFAAGRLLSYFGRRYSCGMSQVDAVASAQSQIATEIQPWAGFGKVKVIQTH